MYLPCVKDIFTKKSELKIRPEAAASEVTRGRGLEEA